MNLGPSIYPSSYVIFSTILVIASKSGVGVEFNLLSLDYDIAPILPNYINIKYTILSGLLLSSEAKDAELNRSSIEFAKKAIFKATISNTRGKRNLPSSSEIALDLDTLGPSLKKKARRISYYTRFTTRATLVDLSKELDIIVPVLDILDLLEAPENLGEKASRVEVVKEVEF
ncbi:uncharacterized protein RCO7_06352 [Rhynchosporium graminicola]|uniref:Uncharacterized protein n=1 Tax=Rhynchosporium graminicola TaxID=2792576 RepID=A0A1E1LRM6_9HELO|nr:uncharacterized protein RCO7_06352 [Rhynchosporium commune]